MIKSRVWTLTCAGAFLMAAGAAAQTTSMAMGADRDTNEPSLLSRPAQLVLQDTTLSSALIRLSEVSGVPLAFSPTLIAADVRRVRCDCAELTIRQALDHLLRQTVFGYRELRGEILVFRQAPYPPVQGPRYATESTRFLPGLPRVAMLSAATMLVESTGTIRGRVVDSGTRTPVSNAQVSIVGTTISTLTDAEGRFLFTSVAAGTVTLSVSRIGYGATQRTVTVETDESVVVNFELTSHALALDEIVVTGTAGGAQRRAIGNVVERIDAGASLAVVPIADVQQLMAFKSPSVSVLPNQGEVGSGGAIRIRGASSLGLSSDPIVYIDGVRMNSDFGGPSREGGGNMSRLNDINPADIESMEIIKGPAAATLYGTEASAGVIQIITKRGIEGAPRFDISIGQGATWFQSPAERLGDSYALDDAGNLVSVNLYEHEEQHGLGPIFQTGHLQNYTASVTGGSGVIRYFVSGNWDDQTGVVDYNWLKGLGTRANLSVLPREDLTFSLLTTYARSTTRKWQGFPDDLYRAVLWGGPDLIDSRTRGFNRRTPEALRDEVERLGRVNRVITAFTVDHRPLSWLTHRLNIGLDVTNENNSILVKRSPLGAAGIFDAQSLGRKMTDQVRSEMVSIDYAGTLNFGLANDISSATSVGLQYFRKGVNVHTSDGRIFPAPGFETTSSAAITSSGEDFFENITVGSYVQQQFGWRDRLFVTGAVRADDNSAFGAAYDAAIYPKLSATWVVHEEPFWSLDWVSQLRLRAAWGAAGRQPDVFDAPRLYDAVTGPGDQAGITPSSFGNPDLKPERSEELEVGFDAGVLNGRVQFAYTHFTKKTRDAIVPVPIPPSMGFPGSQVLNVGALSSWGHEFSLTTRVLDRPGKQWEFAFQTSLLRDRVDDIGPVEFIHVGGSRSATNHRVGYPSQSIFYQRVLSADLHPDGSTTNEMCDGGTGPDGHRPGGPLVPCADAPLIYWGRSGNPTWEGGVASTLTWGDVRLHARVDGRGGHMFMENDNAAAHTTFTNTSWSNLQNNAVFQAYRKLGREALAFTNAGFIRLRDVSATYMLPSGWVERLGGSSASITISGRNMALLWQEQEYVKLPDGSVIPDPKVMDPERRFTDEVGTFHQALMPPLASVLTTIRFSF
jgi:TonB-linked SusC/RagA family outer membrane protein